MLPNSQPHNTDSRTSPSERTDKYALLSRFTREDLRLQVSYGTSNLVSGNRQATYQTSTDVYQAQVEVVGGILGIIFKLIHTRGLLKIEMVVDASKAIY